VTPLLIAVIVVLGCALGVLGAVTERGRRQRAQTMRTSSRRVLFPFAGRALSQRALDAALRIAIADGATLVPVFLARVPLQIPLDSPLPRQCGQGMPLLETIEHRAAALGVPVDARIDRGRTYRHALRETIAHEHYDRLVVAAAGPDSEGFHGDDVAWLLDNAPGEVVMIRPGDADELIVSDQPRRHRRRSPAARIST
jgi:nucleotide-binding universal stress UspA family protein